MEHPNFVQDLQKNMEHHLRGVSERALLLRSMDHQLPGILFWRQILCLKNMGSPQLELLSRKASLLREALARVSVAAQLVLSSLSHKLVHPLVLVPHQPAMVLPVQGVLTLIPLTPRFLLNCTALLPNVICLIPTEYRRVYLRSMEYLRAVLMIRKPVLLRHLILLLHPGMTLISYFVKDLLHCTLIGSPLPFQTGGRF